MSQETIEELESDWNSQTTGEETFLVLSDINEVFHVRQCLVRVTKGVQNDERFVPKTWRDNYQA